MSRKIRSTRNARNTVMRQFHKVGDEKRTPVIIQAENFDHWLGADIPTATQMLSWANMPALQTAPLPSPFFKTKGLAR